MRLPGKLVISLGCAAGGPEIAAAFLAVGCRAFIGSAKFTRCDTVLLLPLAFYSHLAFNGPYSSEAPPQYSEREAFEAVKGSIPQSETFHMYE